jgi:hypothetical protein
VGQTAPSVAEQDGEVLSKPAGIPAEDLFAEELWTSHGCTYTPRGTRISLPLEFPVSRDADKREFLDAIAQEI